MALDRQSIERKDFPIGRRGYEPEVVDAHLAELAAQVDRLQRQLAERPASAGGAGSGGVQSLALAASEQVRMIVEAAETSARDIEDAAQAEAERIRAEADADAEKTRADAISRSEEHVGKVSDATGRMLQRVDAMESELGSLLESLRTGANRLAADLSLVQEDLGELHDRGREPVRAVAQSQLASPPEIPASPPPAPPTPTASAPAPVTPPEAAPAPAAAPRAQDPEPADATPAPVGGGGGGDVEGARLIALNMALNGQTREETDAYLRNNFDLSDRDSLLDEVYATVE